MKKNEELEKELARNERFLYSTNIALAQQSLEEGNRVYAAKILDRYLPNGENAKSQPLRDFEWYHFWHLLHRESLTLQAKNPSGVTSAFSSRRQWVAIVKDGKNIDLHKMAGGEKVAQFKKHASDITRIQFSPDDKYLLTEDTRGTLYICNLPEMKQISELVIKPGEIINYFFSPDGKRVAARGERAAWLWEVESGKRLALEGAQDIRYFTFSPDGKHLAGSGLIAAGLWEVESGKRLALEDAQDISDFTFSPDGKRLAGSGERAAGLWEVKSGKLIVKLQGHNGQVTVFRQHPNQKRLVTGGEDGNVKIWDAQTGQELLTLKGHTAPIDELVFLKNGDWIASRDTKGIWKVWKIATPQEVRNQCDCDEPLQLLKK